MPKQDDYVRITLRLPPDLHDALKASSGARSLNAEIVERLEYTVKLDQLNGSYTEPVVNVAGEAYGRREIAGLLDIQKLSMLALDTIRKGQEDNARRIEALERDRAKK